MDRSAIRSTVVSGLKRIAPEVEKGELHARPDRRVLARQ
jgi:hypothetical protein